MDTFHDVLSQALKQATRACICSAEQIAARFGMSASWLYMACEGERQFHAARLPEFCRMTKSDAPIEWIAAELGGVFYRLPRAEAVAPTTLIATLSAATSYLETASAAMADGVVDEDEASAIEAHCNSAIAAALGLRATAEQMRTTNVTPFRAATLREA